MWFIWVKTIVRKNDVELGKIKGQMILLMCVYVQNLLDKTDHHTPRLHLNPEDQSHTAPGKKTG